jgi:hypothetical protein
MPLIYKSYSKNKCRLNGILIIDKIGYFLTSFDFSIKMKADKSSEPLIYLTEIEPEAHQPLAEISLIVYPRTGPHRGKRVYPYE